MSVLLAATGSVALAGPADFHPGTVIEGYGNIAAVEGAAALPKGAMFKVAFDVSKPAEEGKVNRHLDSAARLINMHGAAGLAPERTSVAVVVHGRAAMDLVNDRRYGGSNVSAGLIAELVAAGVSIELCGQTAAYYDIDVDDLLPGVTMGLSAMTAHALLQQRGYTLNPF